MPREALSPVTLSLEVSFEDGAAGGLGGAVQEEAEERAVGDPEETPAQERPDPPVAPAPAPSLHLHPELNDLHLASLSLLCLPSASCKAQGDDRSPRLGAAWRGCSGFVTLIPAAPVNNLLEAQGERGWVGSPRPARHLE